VAHGARARCQDRTALTHIHALVLDAAVVLPWTVWTPDLQMALGFDVTEPVYRLAGAPLLSQCACRTVAYALTMGCARA
jgi:hypothetical protein